MADWRDEAESIDDEELKEIVAESNWRDQAEPITSLDDVKPDLELARFKDIERKTLASPDHPWRDSYAFQLLYGPAVSTVNQVGSAVVRGAGIAADVVGADETAKALSDQADSMNRYNQAVDEVSRQYAPTEGIAGFADRASRSALSTVPTMAVAGGVGGMPGILGTLGMQTYDRELTTARDAGLPEAEAQSKARMHALNEVAVTSVFNRFAPGLEGMFGKAGSNEVKRGFGAAVKDFAKTTGQELPEEIIVELLNNTINAAYGTDPNALSGENIADTIYETTAATIATVGLAKGVERLNRGANRGTEPRVETGPQPGFQPVNADGTPMTPEQQINKSDYGSRETATRGLTKEQITQVVSNARSQATPERDVYGVIDEMGYLPEDADIQAEIDAQEAAGAQAPPTTMNPSPASGLQEIPETVVTADPVASPADQQTPDASLPETGQTVPASAVPQANPPVGTTPAASTDPIPEEEPGTIVEQELVRLENELEQLAPKELGNLQADASAEDITLEEYANRLNGLYQDIAERAEEKPADPPRVETVTQPSQGESTTPLPEAVAASLPTEQTGAPSPAKGTEFQYGETVARADNPESVGRFEGTNKSGDFIVRQNGTRITWPKDQAVRSDLSLDDQGRQVRQEQGPKKGLGPKAKAEAFPLSDAAKNYSRPTTFRKNTTATPVTEVQFGKQVRDDKAINGGSRKVTATPVTIPGYEGYDFAITEPNGQKRKGTYSDGELIERSTGAAIVRRNPNESIEDFANRIPSTLDRMLKDDDFDLRLSQFGDDTPKYSYEQVDSTDGKKPIFKKTHRDGEVEYVIDNRTEGDGRPTPHGDLAKTLDQAKESRDLQERQAKDREESKARAAEKEAEEAKAKAEAEDLDGFTDEMATIQQKRIAAYMTEQIRLNGKVGTRRDIARQMIDDGYRVASDENWIAKDGRGWRETKGLGKTFFDYARHYQVEKQAAKDRAEMAEIEAKRTPEETAEVESLFQTMEQREAAKKEREAKPTKKRSIDDISVEELTATAMSAFEQPAAAETKKGLGPKPASPSPAKKSLSAKLKDAAETANDEYNATWKELGDLLDGTVSMNPMLDPRFQKVAVKLVVTGVKAKVLDFAVFVANGVEQIGEKNMRILGPLLDVSWQKIKDEYDIDGMTDASDAVAIVDEISAKSQPAEKADGNQENTGQKDEAGNESTRSDDSSSVGENPTGSDESVPANGTDGGTDSKSERGNNGGRKSNGRKRTKPKRNQRDDQQDVPGSTGPSVEAAKPDPKRPEAVNFELTPDMEISKGGPMTKLRRNIEAIKVIRQINQEYRYATPEEQQIIAMFTGWGHLQKFFLPAPTIRSLGLISGDGFSQAAVDKLPDSDEAERGQKLLLSAFTRKEYESARASINNSHYTEPEVARSIWTYVSKVLPKVGKLRVLETSEGSGIFWGTMPQDLSQRSELHGIDLDATSQQVARALYPKVNHVNVSYGETHYPDGYFDVITSNVPFGDYTVRDPDNKELRGLSIHNYFIAKTGYKLREGGIAVFITSHNTMDQLDSSARKAIEATGMKFLGAVRLPSDAFKGIASTAVVTDVMVFQKDSTGASNGAGWIESKEYKVPFSREGEPTRKPVPISTYFANKIGNVLGKITGNGKMYGVTEGVAQLTVESDGRDIITDLNTKLGEIPIDGEAFRENQGSRTDMPTSSVSESLPVPEHLRDLSIGHLVMHNGGLYVRFDEQSMRLIDGKKYASETYLNRFNAWSAVRDVTKELLAAQIDPSASDEHVEGLRKRLNEVYDKFIAGKFGPINHTTNRQRFGVDVDFNATAALENYSNSKEVRTTRTGKVVEETVHRAVKADIFTRRTATPRDTSTPKTPEQIVARLFQDGQGAIDMAQSASMLGVDEAKAEKLLSPYVILTPNRTYQVREVYLSGDLNFKIKEAEQASQEDSRFNENVDALKAKLPPPKKFGEFVVQINSPFLPESVFTRFAQEKLGVGRFTVTRGSQSAGGGFVVSNQRMTGLDSTANTNLYAANGTSRSRTAVEILTRLIEGKNLRVTYVIEGKTYVDEEATQLSEEAGKQLGLVFQEWLPRADDLKQQITDSYNEVIGGMIDPVIPGWAVSLDGMSDVWKKKIRDYQKEGAARVALGNNTLLAFRVGYGKTLTAIAGIMEQRRLGTARKPVVVVPGHLVNQWGRDFAQIYPNSRVLVATKKDLSPQGRGMFFNRIRTGDWDAIIVAESSFGLIPMSSSYTERFFSEAIAEVEDQIAAEDRESIAAGNKKRDRSTKEWEKLRKRLQKMMDDRLNLQAKDPGPFFDELGIDSLTVDEAHGFKNLFFITREMRVPGINPQGNQKTFDMLMKTDFINSQSGSRNVTFLTGTPIANSMGEAWAMMRYLMPDLMRRRGILAFDNWKNAFGEVVSLTRIDPVGRRFRDEIRFARFVNVGNLRKLWSQMAQTLMRSNEIDAPPFRGGKVEIDVTVPPSYVADFNTSLAARAFKKPKDPSIDNVLKIMSDGAKASMDMRLVNQAILPADSTKVTAAAKSIGEIYRQTESFKGAQIVWADRGVPKKAKKFTEAMKEMSQWIFDESLNGPVEMEAIQEKWAELDTTKKTKSNLKALFRQIDDDVEWIPGDEGDGINVGTRDEPIYISGINRADPDIVSEEPPPWNVYKELRERLVAEGVKDSEIASIYDYDTPVRKLELYDMVNSGKVRVLMASTLKAGTGANIQQRLVAAHHLDAPWRPADVEQRDGRIIRSGNKSYYLKDGRQTGFIVDAGLDWDGVIVRRYVTEGSIDARYWDTLETKAKTLEGFYNGEGSDEMSDIGDTSMEYADMAAASSTNPKFAELTDVERKLKALQAEQRSMVARQENAKDDLEKAQKTVTYFKGLIAQVEEKNEERIASRKDVPENVRMRMVTPDGQTLDKAKEQGEYILRKAIDAASQLKPLILDSKAGLIDKKYKAPKTKPIQIGTGNGQDLWIVAKPGWSSTNTKETFGFNNYAESEVRKHEDASTFEIGLSSLLVYGSEFDARTSGAKIAEFGGSYNNTIGEINIGKIIADQMQVDETTIPQAKQRIADAEKSIPELREIAAIEFAKQDELYELARRESQLREELGDDADDEVQLWVASQELMDVMGTTPQGEFMIERADSGKTEIGTIMGGLVKVWNRNPDDTEDRPPVGKMVYLRGEGLDGYHPRDEKGVLGEKIIKPPKDDPNASSPLAPPTDAPNLDDVDDGQDNDGPEYNAARRKAQNKQGNASTFDAIDRTNAILDNAQSLERDDRSEDAISKGQVLKTLERLFNTRFDKGRTPKVAAKFGKIEGVFQALSPNNNVSKNIRLHKQHTLDLMIASHELGHFIDRETGIASVNPRKRQIDIPRNLRMEVQNLDLNGENQLEEGFAEFIRIWLTEPNTMNADGAWVTGNMAHAPAFTEWFENTWMPAHPEMAQRLKRARGYIKKFHDQSFFTEMRTMLGTRPADDMDFWERLKQSMHKSLRAFQRAMFDTNYATRDIDRILRANGWEGMSIEEVMGRYSFSAIPEAMMALENGVRDIRTGAKIGARGLWDRVGEQLINDVERDEAAEYALMRHTVFMDKQSKKRAAQAKARYDANREAMKKRGQSLPPYNFTPPLPYSTGVPVEKAQQFIDIIGKDPSQQARYEKVAEIISDFAHELLEMRVRAGGLSRESANRIVKRYNKNYFPMHRVMDKSHVGMSSRSTRSVLTGYYGIKGRSNTGSDAQVQNPFESLQRMAVEYYAAAGKARVNELLHEAIDRTEGSALIGVKVAPEMVRSNFDIAEVLKQLVDGGWVEADDARAGRISGIMRGVVAGELSNDDMAWFGIRHGLDHTIATEQELKDAADSEPRIEDTIAVFRPDFSSNGKEQISVRYDRNGNKSLYQYDKEIHAMLSGLHQQHLHAALRMLRKGTRGFKLGTVGASPTFGVANMLKDYYSFQGRARYTPGLRTFTTPVRKLATTVKTRFQQIRGVDQSQMDSLQLFYDDVNGTTMSIIGTDATSLHTTARKRLGKSRLAKMGLEKGNVVRGLWGLAKGAGGGATSFFENMVAITDMPPRLSEIEWSIRRDGWAPLKGGQWVNLENGSTRSGLPEEVVVRAVTAAAEATVNFRRRGHTSNVIDIFMPFHVATINSKVKYAGLLKNAATNFNSSNELDRNQARRLIVHHALTASMALLYVLMRQDDDDYKEQEDWLRDRSWNFAIYGKTRLRIPMSYDEIWIKKLVEDAVRDQETENPRGVSEVLQEEAIDWMPKGGGPVWGSVETAMDYDFFKQRPVESGFEYDDRSDRYKSNDRTTTIAKQIAPLFSNSKGDGLSPVQIDHLLDSATGGKYTDITQALSNLASGELQANDIPAVKALTVSRNQAQSVYDLYERQDVVVRQKADAQYLRELASQSDDTKAFAEADKEYKAKLNESAEIHVYRDLMSAISREQRKQDDRYAFTPQLVGLAREVMGRQPLDMNPSPFADGATIPEAIKPVVKDFVKDRLKKTLLGEDRPRSDSETQGTKEEQTEKWEARREADYRFLKKHVDSPIIREVFREAMRDDSVRGRFERITTMPKIKDVTESQRKKGFMRKDAVERYQDDVQDRAYAIKIKALLQGR